LKQILNWHASNQMHFHLVLPSNQSRFLVIVIFKFFVPNAFQLAIRFHRFHLKQIQN
jgi:hypothetical protein